MSTTFVNLYQILEIQPNATEDQIKKAITTQRRTWTKRQQAPNKEKQREAEDRIKHIDQASTTLLNAERRKQYDQQLANYRPPAPETGPSLEGSQDWLQRAKDFLARGEAQSAAYAARQATEQHGANHEAWAIRAHANALAGRGQDAEFEFNEAIRIKPDEPEYHFDLGSFFESRSKWASALRSYQTASSLAPTVPAYRVAIASVYLQNDMAGQALPIMEQVHRECPDVEDFTFYLALALNDSLVATWTKLKSGGHIITTPDQIARTREVLGRAKALKFDDAELRGVIEANLKLADEAEKVKFRMPGTQFVRGAADGSCQTVIFASLAVCFFWLAIPAIAFAANPGVGILVTGLWIFMFYKLGFRPSWKWADIDTKGVQVK